MSPKIKWIAWGAFIIMLVYTRFINLSWGLPRSFHADEWQNLVLAIQQLSCGIPYSLLDIQNCLNPHIFTYGPLSIYSSYVLVLLSRAFSYITGPIQLTEAIIALRLISAAASVATVLVSIKILKQVIPNTRYLLLYTIPFIFSPALIQFAHFGTTESLLALWYTWIVHLCLKLLDISSGTPATRIYVYTGTLVGLAIATKVSSASFFFLPFLVVALVLIRGRKSETKASNYERFWEWLNQIIFMGFVAGAVAILAAPYNLIGWREFTASLQYESAVATGKLAVFYTRSFDGTIPILFQFKNIFPYALGWPITLAFIFGFFTLPFTKKNNFLRLAFLIYFLPWAFMFTKWTRYMAPVFPLMIIFAVLFASRLPKRLGYLACLLFIIPGILFLKVYTTPDVRSQASEWMVKNIPSNSVILQETANLVDLPIFASNFKSTSFNFYELDADEKLQQELLTHLKKVDYIIIPSRRIFKNHSKEKYPVLNKYYEDLFSGKLGFTKVSEFKVLDDEDAEETWTVFDHPVVRIYKRT